MRSRPVLGAAVAAVALTASVRAGQPAPNVVFILADDLGWGDLGCFGHDLLQTPRLDELADQGTRFTQFYVASPVCSPTRAAYMTGRFPGELRIHTTITPNPVVNAGRGVVDWLDPALPTVTGKLSAAGYATGYFGKWHLGSAEGAPDPGAYGIDVHVTTSSTGPGFPQEDEEYFRANSTEYLVDEAIDFIEAHADAAFFLTVSTLLPHAILNPTPEQMALYANLSPPDVPFTGAMQVYYASVTAMDEQIGRLVDRIDDLGLAESTLIIFTSDNGPPPALRKPTAHSGVGATGPFRGAKWSLYEGGIRMPLIVRWPGHVPAGAVDNTSVVSIVDFLPTLCAIAGCPPDSPPFDPGWLARVTSIRAAGAGSAADEGSGTDGSGLDGEDVSDVLLGTPRARTRPLFWQYRFNTLKITTLHRSPMLAVRDGNWKLLMNPPWSPFERMELYDVVNDPAEVDNVATNFPDVVAQLSAEVLTWSAGLAPGTYGDQAGSNDYPWP